MNLFGYTFHRLTLGVLGIILILALVAFGTSQCSKRRDAASQARMDAAQGQAASESGRDAIGTVARSGEAAAASEELTRANEQAIRNATGADDRVNLAVHVAGLKALCRRKAFADDPRCAPFKGGVK